MGLNPFEGSNPSLSAILFCRKDLCQCLTRRSQAFCFAALHTSTKCLNRIIPTTFAIHAGRFYFTCCAIFCTLAFLNAPMWQSALVATVFRAASFYSFRRRA